MTTQTLTKAYYHQTNEMTEMELHYNDALHSDKQYALVLINIKNFRFYNTLYGSVQGNKILSLIYQTLTNQLQEEERIMMYYADNYIVLIHNKNIEQLHERMINFLNQCYRIDDETIYRNIFLTIGIYELKYKKVDFYTALSYANLARKCNESYTHRCHSYEIYDKTYYDTYMKQIKLENKTADAYKNYEFIPFLQPKVDPKTNRIVGAEALLRWFDEDGKMVPLTDFLPILDKNGYIALVDLDIFEIVCKMLHQNLETGKAVVPISFNLSKSAFYRDADIAAYVEICNKYQIPHDLIDIEFMESISLDDTDRMKKIIQEFKKVGFHCSLDDFGNGYSSFNVLLNADLDTIKMDRQFFLKNLNGDNKLIIKTVIDLIKSLHMKITAEGVETKEYVDYLCECGCDAIQGYYYYKPMPVDEFNQILQETNVKK